MICIECGKDMDSLTLNDSGTGGYVFRGKDIGDVAYNVGHCSVCFVVAVQAVWSNPRTTYILPDGSVEQIIGTPEEVKQKIKTGREAKES